MSANFPTRVKFTEKDKSRPEFKLPPIGSSIPVIKLEDEAETIFELEDEVVELGEGEGTTDRLQVIESVGQSVISTVTTTMMTCWECLEQFKLRPSNTRKVSFKG